jgi:hypothetical protein
LHAARASVRHAPAAQSLCPCTFCGYFHRLTALPLARALCELVSCRAPGLSLWPWRSCPVRSCGRDNCGNCAPFSSLLSLHQQWYKTSAYISSGTRPQPAASRTCR